MLLINDRFNISQKHIFVLVSLELNRLATELTSVGYSSGIVKRQSSRAQFLPLERGGGWYFRNFLVGMCCWDPGNTRASSAEFCYPILE